MPRCQGPAKVLIGHVPTSQKQVNELDSCLALNAGCSKADMALGLMATLDCPLNGAFGAILVLLVVLAVSVLVIQRQSSIVQAPMHEDSTVEDLKPKDVEMIEEGKDERVEKNPDAKTLTEWEAAHAAAESGNLTELRRLILERGVHVDAEDQYSMTLLQVASRRGHLHIVQFLIENNATVNATELDGRAALHFAVIRGHTSIARFLLEQGADMNLRKRLGLTPLHVVAQTSHTDLVEILLEHGAEMEAPDDNSDTPLDWAITFGSGVMVQALLEQGAILRDRDSDGKKPMERAVKGWDVLKIDVLAKRGQALPANHKDMQRVMILYAMRDGQIKDERT